MSTPYLGEIRITTYSFVHRYWAKCDGQVVTISQNSALFSLLGITYGGNGTSYFNLPDLRGRIPVGQGTGYALGAKAGVESVALTMAQIPAHSHPLYAVPAAGTAASPGGATWAGSQLAAYSTSASPTLVPMAGNELTVIGGGAAHENRMPSLALNFQIALTGLFPSRS